MKRVTYIKHQYFRELGIRVVQDYKSKPALIIGLWKWTVRVEW